MLGFSLISLFIIKIKNNYSVVFFPQHTSFHAATIRLAWRPLMKIASQNSCKLMPFPTLFAGLLNSNGQLGPAEIPNKSKISNM
jgi:hypothetical protein